MMYFWYALFFKYMKPKITLKKIAKQFEVSISTVSKALKDSHEIGAELKERIQDFAAKHHYKPNSLAVRLQNQQTKTIGVVIPNIVHHFFSTVIQGIEEITNQRGYNVMICLSNESFDKEVLNVEILMEASRIHKKPAATQSIGECGTKNKASELNIAPTKK